MRNCRQSFYLLVEAVCCILHKSSVRLTHSNSMQMSSEDNHGNKLILLLLLLLPRTLICCSFTLTIHTTVELNWCSKYLIHPTKYS